MSQEEVPLFDQQLKRARLGPAPSYSSSGELQCEDDTQPQPEPLRLGDSLLHLKNEYVNLRQQQQQQQQQQLERQPQPQPQQEQRQHYQQQQSHTGRRGLEPQMQLPVSRGSADTVPISAPASRKRRAGEAFPVEAPPDDKSDSAQTEVEDALVDADVSMLPFYKRLVEVMPDVVEFVDPGIRLQHVNPAFEEITGFKRGDVMGRTTAELFRSEYATPAYYKDIMSTIKRTGKWQGMMASKRADGTMGFFSSTLADVKNPSGEVIGYVSCKQADDEERITEGAPAAQQLDEFDSPSFSTGEGTSSSNSSQVHGMGAGGRHMQAASRLRSMIDSSSDAWFLTARDGKIMDCNPAAVHLLGEAGRYSLIGRLLSDYIQRDCATQGFAKPWQGVVISQVDRAESPGLNAVRGPSLSDSFQVPSFVPVRACSSEALLREALEARRERHVEGKSRVVTLGGTAFDFVSVRDITERVVMEQLLQAKNREMERANANLERVVEERTRQLEKATKLHANFWGKFFPMTVHLASDGAIVDWSLSLAEWMRPFRLEESKESIRDMLNPELTKEMQRRRDVDDFSEFAIEVARDDGNLVMRAVLVAVDMPEKSVAFAMYLKDDTQHRLDEQQERDREHRESVGRLAFGLAHDFNNLLVPVLGNAETLLGDASDAEKVRTGAEEIMSATKIARDICGKILTLARRSGHDSASVSFSAQERCSKLMKVIRNYDKSVLVRYEPGDKELFVRGRPSDLDQIVLNLCGNAIRAMSDQPERVLTLAISDKKNGDGVPGVCFTVEDTGCGIPRKNIAKIFQPYFSEHKERRSTGLGLAQVETLVRVMGGVISIESEVNVGTQFSVWLPEVDKVIEPLHSQRRPSIFFQERKYRVIAIDDDRVSLAILKRSLERLGCEVNAIRGGTGVKYDFDSFNEHDIVFLDWHMPEMDGSEIQQIVHGKFKYLPIVKCSGFVSASDDGARPPMRSESPLFMLPKPFTQEELRNSLDVVGRYLDDAKLM